MDASTINGSILQDLSGNGNNATLVASPTSTPGKINEGLLFNGASQYATTTLTTYLITKTTPFSLTAWIKTTATLQEIIFSNWAVLTSPGWQFDVNQNVASGKISFGLFNASATGGRYVTGSTTTITNGALHFVAVTYSGSNTAAGLKLYVDRGYETTGVVLDTDPGALVDDGFRIAVRNYGAAPSYFNGGEDDGRFYNRELISGELSQIYDAGIRGVS